MNETKYYKRIDDGDTIEITKEEYDEAHHLFPKTIEVEGISFPKVDYEVKFPKDKKKTGERHNKNKLRWRNVPLFLIRPLIEVGHFGEGKYETFNFLKGLPINDIMDSLKRHLDKLEDPTQSDYDDETGLSHSSHIMWNAMVLDYMLKNRLDLDNRWGPEE